MYDSPPYGGEQPIMGGNSPPPEMGWGGALPPKSPPHMGGDFRDFGGDFERGGGERQNLDFRRLPPIVGGSTFAPQARKKSGFLDDF